MMSKKLAMIAAAAVTFAPFAASAQMADSTVQLRPNVESAAALRQGRSEAEKEHRITQGEDGLGGPEAIGNRGSTPVGPAAGGIGR